MNDNIAVKIVGDASQVAPAVDVAKGSIAGLGTAVEGVNAQMGGLGVSMRTAFAGAASAANDAAAVVTGAGEKMALAGENVKLHWEGVGAAMSKLNGIMLGLTAVLAGGELFKESIDATTKLTQENLRLSQAMGISLEKASGLHAAINKLGIETDTMTGASQRMVRQLKAHENSFNDLGIATRDANGHFRDTLDIFTDGVGKLGEYRAGVDRTAAAQIMFGRGAGDLTSILRLNRAEIEEGTRAAKELGLVTTEQGVEAMHRYKDSVHEVSEVMEAFKIAVGSALLPVLTDLAEWFRGNGVSAVHAFVGAMKDVIDECRRTVLEFQIIVAEVNYFVAAFMAACERIEAGAEILDVVFQTLGQVMRDAFALNWGQIEGDWNAGMAKVDQIVTAHARHIAGEMNAAKSAVDALTTAYRNVGSPSAPGKSGPLGPEPSALRLDNITGKEPKAPKEKKEKAPKDDLVQRLEEELEAKKTAWGLEQEAQGTAQAFSLQSESDYWAAALQRTDLSAKDKLAIERKWLAARQALQKDQIAEQLEVYKSDIEEAGKNWTEKLAILKAEEAYITKMYGAESKEAQAARDAVIKAEHEKADQLRQIADQMQKHRQDLSLLEIDEAQAAAQQRVAMGQETEAQLLQQEKQFENQRHEIRKAALQADLALVDPFRDPVQYQKISQQIETLDQQHQNKLSEIDRRAVLERTAIERTAVSSVSSSWSQAMGQLLTGQITFANAIRQMFVGLQQAVGNALASMIQKWLTQKLSALLIGKAADTSAGAAETARNAATTAAKLASITSITTATIASNTAMMTSSIATTKATAAAVIPTQIGIAGASGVASFAAAPWPIDMGAPAFGASMAATAASLGSVASFDIGAWNLSKDQLAMVHSGEMIIPAEMAGGMRSLMKGAANNNSPIASNDAGGQGGGDVHLHYAPTIHERERVGLKQLLASDGTAMLDFIHRQVRDGKLKLTSA